MAQWIYKEVSITVSGSENPEKELSEIVKKVKALPLAFFDENGNDIKVEVKLAETISNNADIDIKPVPKMGTKEISFEVADDYSCVKFEKMTPRFLRIVHDENVFFVILKTEES